MCFSSGYDISNRLHFKGIIVLLFNYLQIPLTLGFKSLKSIIYPFSSRLLLFSELYYNF